VRLPTQMLQNVTVGVDVEVPAVDVLAQSFELFSVSAIEPRPQASGRR